MPNYLDPAVDTHTVIEEQLSALKAVAAALNTTITTLDNLTPDNLEIDKSEIKLTLQKSIQDISGCLDTIKRNLGLTDFVTTNSLQAMVELANKYDQSNEPSLQRQAAMIDKFISKFTEDQVTAQDLEFLSSFATELDRTGDPVLIKEASVLDQILITFGQPQSAQSAFKAAEDTEVDRLRSKYRQEGREHVYQKSKEQLDKDMKVADTLKAINQTVKQYRPLEASLSTRTCPDHPGAQMSRIGEYIYQCLLDKQVYNYQSGFQTMTGNTVPGGDVSGQTQFLADIPPEHLQFDTRHSKLNT